MGKKQLKAPSDVRQDYGDTCWAAVLESFCAASIGRPPLKQADIVKQFDHLCVGGKTGKDGTMSRAGMHTMFKDKRFGLNVEEISPEYFKSTVEYLPIRLQKGLVILGYWEKFIPGWHVGLVYGIDDKTVNYMNPDYTRGGYLKNDLSYFTTGKGNLIVAWPAW